VLLIILILFLICGHGIVRFLAILILAFLFLGHRLPGIYSGGGPGGSPITWNEFGKLSQKKIRRPEPPEHFPHE